MATLTEQLQAMRQLGDNWDGYGGAAPRAEVIDLAQAFTALLQTVPPPRAGSTELNVSPNRVGGILIEWEDVLWQHEVEINPDGSMSFLHLNKTTKQIETRKFSPGQPSVIHPGVLRELQTLLAA
jgi:hypothetical protein